MGADGLALTVLDIEDGVGEAVVYDLSVAGLRTFYVASGDGWVLVHNAGNCDLGPNRGWRNLNDRQFRQFLESLEGRASTSGGATRDAAETRAILDEALSRGYRIIRGPEESGDWIGGRHIDLGLPTSLTPVEAPYMHFPIPDDFQP